MPQTIAGDTVKFKHFMQMLNKAKDDFLRANRGWSEDDEILIVVGGNAFTFEQLNIALGGKSGVAVGMFIEFEHMQLQGTTRHAANCIVETNYINDVEAKDMH